jgi:hypothetical protein
MHHFCIRIFLRNLTKQAWCARKKFDGAKVVLERIAARWEGDVRKFGKLRDESRVQNFALHFSRTKNSAQAHA